MAVPSVTTVTAGTNRVATTTVTGTNRVSAASTRASNRSSKVAPEPDAPSEQQAFVSISADLGALIISSWLVPTVTKPTNTTGIVTFILALSAQIGILSYMIAAMWTANPPKSPCSSPAMLQIVGLFIFMAVCVDELKSLTLLQIAAYTTRLRVVPTADQPQKEETIIEVRPTTQRVRYNLMLVPLAQLVIELATLVVGCIYLLLSDNIEELVLNTVAVNFVTQIDDVMLRAYVHKGRHARLAKYLYEIPWGISEGDTRLKNISERSLKLKEYQEKAPSVVLLVSIVSVVIGQAYGLGTGYSAQCSWVTVT